MSAPAVPASVTFPLPGPKDERIGFDGCRNFRIVRKESSVGDRGYMRGQIRDHGSMGNPILRGWKTVLFEAGRRCSGLWCPPDKDRFVEEMRAYR